MAEGRGKQARVLYGGKWHDLILGINPQYLERIQGTLSGTILLFKLLEDVLAIGGCPTLHLSSPLPSHLFWLAQYPEHR